jgi:uncharacterized protein
MKTLSAVVAAGAGLAAYSLAEPYRFRLRRVVVPVVAPGAPRLTVLHISDTHFLADDRRLSRFLRDLPEKVGAEPDLVIATGDLIEDDTGIDPAVEALEGLPARLGRFYVLGSHDYYQSVFQAYTKYFTKRRPVGAPPAATDRLEKGLGDAGWRSLTNSTEFVAVGGNRIRLAGVDDPYIDRHRTGHIERTPEDDLAIGVMHAPDVVSEFALAGFDLALAGHTHAGQVRPPLLGTVVTNCSLPRALGSRFSRVGDMWLHVSPGLGSGRFAPIRFNCRPEATLLELRPARGVLRSPR